MSFDHVQLKDALAPRLSSAGQAGAWAALLAAGVTGLRVPEARGGLGLPFAEVEPVLEVLGELCLGVPFLETGIVAAGVLARAPAPAGDALLEAIAAQGAVVAVAGLEAVSVVVRAEDGARRLYGQARIVVEAASARALLVLAGLPDGTSAFFLVDPSSGGLSMRPVATIDGRMAADLDFAGVVAGAPIAPAGGLDLVLDEATASICVEAAGLMRRLVRDTADYARQRRQFDQPLSGFQVVRHRLVDMNIHARRATAIARRAVAAIDGDPAARARLVSAAKVTICRAGRLAA